MSKCPGCGNVQKVQQIGFGAQSSGTRWYLCVGPHPEVPGKSCGSTWTEA